jgi:hypothetical protein
MLERQFLPFCEARKFVNLGQILTIRLASKMPTSESPHDSGTATSQGGAPHDIGSGRAGHKQMLPGNSSWQWLDRQVPP